MTKNGHVYTPSKTREYEKLVLQCWKQQSGVTFPKGTPLQILVKAHFNIPKSVSKKKRQEMIGAPHLHKPDSDNILKAVVDGISGTVFYDDAEICHMDIIKNYAEEGSVEVEVAECVLQ